MKITIMVFFVLFGISPLLNAQSRCVETSQVISCTNQESPISGNSRDTRRVLWEVPMGTPPDGGWPVVLMYQGTSHPVEFTRDIDDPGGNYYQVETIKELLDNGYAVVAPRGINDGPWQTNLWAGIFNYPNSDDFQFLSNVFTAIANGDFGPLNPNKKYATGLSSGGYNTSRMAVSFQGQFNSLVIHSGSYATCLGFLCSVPQQLPANHPPTFFIHGADDGVVPSGTMEKYYDRLLSNGRVADKFVKQGGGHSWFPESPGLIRAWFDQHP
jgi:poly(3-hydroxyoctanoate) depolymerase